MSLDKKVIKDFVAAVNKKEETKTPTILTGTVHREGGTVFVKIDGSESLTPVSTVINVENGERVTLTIENHKAMITGNLSSPAARGNEVEDLKVIVGDKVSTAELEAITAKVGEIDGDVANFKETTTEKLTAQEANIKKIDGDVANFKETTTAKLNANEANIKKIDGDVASFKETTTAKLNANSAAIGSLDSTFANFKDATAEKFKANEASIENLKTGKLSAKDADLKYANIDFSNIGKTAMEYFYAQSGLVKDVKIGDATITGELVGVTISGDLLKGNTVVADKLVIKGSDGLYYKLNTDGMSVEKEQTDYNSLNGQVIRAKSITATKIDVEDLVAFGATIGGFKIGQDSIYSGVKESVGNTTRGIYMDNDGQFVFGDANQYVKFYKISEGKYKLAIAVEDLYIGSANVADAISDAKNTADNAASVASSAKSTAESASSAASTANSTANAAKSTAEGASKTASDAKSTADSASQVASNASSVAGAAKTTADNASKAASEANSTASTAKSTADQAKSTADTATKNLTALTKQVTEAETTIKKNKEEIELRAKKTEVTEAIDNIDIGGRNLFLGTSRYSAESPFSTTSKHSDNYIISFDDQIIYSNEVFKQGDVIAVQAESNLKWSTSHNDDGSRGKAGFWLYIGRKEQILVGDYTYPLFLGGDGQSTKFRKVLQLQKYGDLTEYYICFRFNTYGNGTDNLTGKLWNLKLERGNKVTDWSPAPEDYYTKTETDASIKVLSDKITQQVSTTDDLGKRMSKVEQDSSSWSVTLETANAAKSAADNASRTASSAKSAADKANENASSAAKTATNYMKFDNSGLTVGDLTGNTLGRNVNIDNRSVNIRNGTNALASFSDKLIELGKSSSDASISLLNKQLVIGAEAKTVDGFNFNSATMTGKEGVYISAGDPDIIDDETYTSALSILNDGKQPLIGMTVTKSRAHGFYNFGPTIASLDTESSSGYANVTIKSDETTSQVELRTQGAHGTRVLYNYSHALSYYVDGAIRCEYTGDTPCLWDGALHMNADQVVTLSAPISQQPHGILLVFAAYDPGPGAITNYMTMPCFVPKQAMGYWWWIPVFWENTWQMCTKQLYVTNTQIQGHANNVGVYNKANTDINVNGLYFTLRRVYGV